MLKDANSRILIQNIVKRIVCWTSKKYANAHIPKIIIYVQCNRCLPNQI